MRLNQLNSRLRQKPVDVPVASDTSADHPLMTVREAAEMLGFSCMTIRRRIEARQFPAVKIGTKALVPRAFIERLLEAALAGQTVVVEEFAADWSSPASGGAA